MKKLKFVYYKIHETQGYYPYYITYEWHTYVSMKETHNIETLV